MTQITQILADNYYKISSIRSIRPIRVHKKICVDPRHLRHLRSLYQATSNTYHTIIHN